MRRSPAILLCILMLLALAACKQAPDAPASTAGNTAATIPSGMVATVPTQPSTTPTVPLSEETSTPTEPHQHNYTPKVTAPTCTEQGYTTYTCDCGDTYDGDKTTVLPHNYKAVVTAPTCTKDGYTTHTCTCGDSYTDSKLPASGHSYSQWETTKQPTITSTGTAQRKCTACGDTETRTLEKLIENHTHSYKSTVTKAATCTANGVRTISCSCGDRYTESIPKIAHTYTQTVTAPTCTTEGYTTYRCACGDTYTGAKTAVLPHDYKAVVTAPTCATEGYTTYTCTKCSASYTGNRTPMTGHKYVSTQTKAPTCTSTGTMTYTCSVCNFSFTTRITNLGHNYKITSQTKATCTTTAMWVETCANCQDTKTHGGDAIPGGTHTNLHVNDTMKVCTEPSSVTTLCLDCGTIISQTERPAQKAHSYKTMKVSEAAKILFDRGVFGYGYYMNFTDWVVEACEHCYCFDDTKIRFAYTPREAAEIMLGYVNELRAEEHGDDYDPQKHDLKLHNFLINRSVEVARDCLPYNYEHSDQAARFDAAENICNAGPNIIDQFIAWKKSPSHYRTMVDKDNRFFGYGIGYTENFDHGGFYGCQLFFSLREYWEYQDITGDFS